MYVEGLAAPDTVNTMPMPTLLAAADHAEITGATADVGKDAVDQALAQLASAGIDMKDVTDKLLADGVRLFEVAMEKLIAGVESKREAVVTGRPTTLESLIPDELEPAIARRVQEATEQQVARRIWQRDESLWGGPGVPEIGNRLGWLTEGGQAPEEAGGLGPFRGQFLADGFTGPVLLGMGGSSLAPLV